MRKWIGAICVLAGAVCLLCAAGLAVYNQWEDKNAGEMSHALLGEIKSKIGENQLEPPLLDDIKTATVKAEGYDCMGILSVPVLDLELPVLAEWSYAKLKNAPCCYYGSCCEKDFVIAAHNYKAHFGRLSELKPDDAVVFTDVSGMAHYYKVVSLETLPQNATKEMITSGFDLSLYTCTPGGGGRVTVRCTLVQGPLTN